jgi:hypothetical protein
MGNKALFTKTEFRLAMENCDGHIGVLAERLNVTRRTVYRYLEKFPELQTVLKAERRSGRDEIVELAQTKLVQGILANNDRLIMFALRHYDADGVPGAVDLGSLFAPDVLEYLNNQGVQMSDVVKSFESMIRMQAEKVK